MFSSNRIEFRLKKIIEKFNVTKNKKYTLIILFGLLGDFDSIEYAINLKRYLDSNSDKDLSIFAIAIGNEAGKEKFCEFTGFPKENLEVTSDNKIHTDLMISKGIDIGLGGWVNMFLMLAGVNSLKTIREVIRGYTGDKNARQIFSEQDRVELFKYLTFSGKSFNKAFGDGYLRPFELATFRLNNMIEIIQNWKVYILNEKFLPQRGATFIMDNKNHIIFQYFSKDVLGYSSTMNDPLRFLYEKCK